MSNEGAGNVARVTAAWLAERVACDEIATETARAYRANIRSFVSFVGPDTALASIEPSDLKGWMAHLVERGLLPSSRAVMLGTIKQFFAWAQDEEHIGRNPAAKLKRPRPPKGPPRHIPMAELDRVIGMADFRSQVMTILAAQLALRRSEVANLRVEDWDRERQYLTIRGKGAKTRHEPVPRQAAEMLDRWLRDGRTSGPMWPSQKRPAEGLSAGSVSRVLKDAARRADANYRPHDLRHTGLTDMRRNGADITEIAEVAGHESIATTAGYIHVEPEHLRRAVEGRTYGQVAMGGSQRMGPPQ